MTRPLPPWLEFSPPPCTLCGGEVDSDGDDWICHGCGLTWDRYGANTEWLDPAAMWCASLHFRAQSFGHRCSRNAGHDGLHFSVCGQRWLLGGDDGAARALSRPCWCNPKG